MNGVEDVLVALGYDLKNESSNYWRALPRYRESSNASTLRISKNNGNFVDFAANIKGNINDLVKLSLGLGSIQEARTWVDSFQISKSVLEKKPKIFLDKKIDLKYIDGLMPHYSFYTAEPRCISKEVLEKFECGVCFSGKQNNRFVFVIRDENGDVKGVAGRDLIGGRVKWKLMGDKRRWIFPLGSLPKIEESKKLVLIESIGDALALYDIGVENVLITFGLDLSNKLTNFISSLDLDEIIISLNNDSNKEKNWGQLASEQMRNKLSKLMDLDKIKISPPPFGDWGETKKEERLVLTKHFYSKNIKQK